MTRIAETRTGGRHRAPSFVSTLAALALASSAIVFAPTTGGAQHTLHLVLPVACALGDTCYVQQYVDRDPSPGIRDFGCGVLANDGHKGTDFAIPTRADMARGVQVIAAAAGTVRGMRDGMEDMRQSADGAPEVAGVECGNGALIDHGGGWETQYCHLRKGSLTVAPGDTVDAGTPLGFIGLSGKTSFPHVHFEVRHDGRVVDPFLPNPAAECGAATGALWISEVPYSPGGPVAAGLTDGIPDLDAIDTGLPEDALEAASGSVVLWVLLANVRAGDLLNFEIVGPDGAFAEKGLIVSKSQPIRMEAFGRRAPRSGLPAGDWTGRVVHSRDGAVLGERTVRATTP